MTNKRFTKIPADRKHKHDIVSYHLTYHGADVGTVGKRLGFTFGPGKPVVVYWVGKTWQGLESPKFRTRTDAARWLISAVVTGARP